MHHGRTDGQRGDARLESETLGEEIGDENDQHHTEHNHCGGCGEGGIRESADGESGRAQCDLTVRQRTVGVVYLSRKIMSVVMVDGGDVSNDRDGGAENNNTGDHMAEAGSHEAGRATEMIVNMRNGRVVAALAAVIWLMLVVMNGALLVLVGLGKS